MAIDTEAKLRVHLKIFKRQALQAGADPMAVYPAFCQYHHQNKHKYDLPKEQLLDIACQVLIEEE